MWCHCHTMYMGWHSDRRHTGFYKWPNCHCTNLFASYHCHCSSCCCVAMSSNCKYCRVKRLRNMDCMNYMMSSMGKLSSSADCLKCTTIWCWANVSQTTNDVASLAARFSIGNETTWFDYIRFCLFYFFLIQKKISLFKILLLRILEIVRFLRNEFAFRCLFFVSKPHCLFGFARSRIRLRFIRFSSFV